MFTVSRRPALPIPALSGHGAKRHRLRGKFQNPLGFQHNLTLLGRPLHREHGFAMNHCGRFIRQLRVGGSARQTMLAWANEHPSNLGCGSFVGLNGDVRISLLFCAGSEKVI